MANPVFLLSGWSTSGKDTVGQILQSKFGFQRFAFADILKELLATEFYFPVDWAHSESGKLKIPNSSNGKTVRQLLIQRGQEIRSEKGDPGFFARFVASKIKMSKKPIVITDWRLNIELETLRSEIQNPIFTVRIHRTGLLQSPIQNSFTETELDTFNFDIYVENSGTSPEELYEEIIKKLSPWLHFN